MIAKKSIIFDLEGVVIDTQPIWDEIDIVFLGRRGIKPDIHEKARRLMGKNLEEGVVIMMQMYNFTGDVKDLLAERKEIAENLLRTEVSFIPGFLGFFDKIKDTYSVAVATSMERLFFNDVDKRLNLTDLFSGHIYSIEDIGFISKPNPDIFIHAAIKLGVEPSECIVMEDAPHGVTAANKANMYCIGITTSTTKDNLTHADQVVSSYAEIKL